MPPSGKSCPHWTLSFLFLQFTSLRTVWLVESHFRSSFQPLLMFIPTCSQLCAAISNISPQKDEQNMLSITNASVMSFISEMRHQFSSNILKKRINPHWATTVEAPTDKRADMTATIKRYSIRKNLLACSPQQVYLNTCELFACTFACLATC